MHDTFPISLSYRITQSIGLSLDQKLASLLKLYVVNSYISAVAELPSIPLMLIDLISDIIPAAYNK